VEGGRSFSSLTEVTSESRVDELVRMLGGGGKQAQEMAKSLLK
jgi:DNA repair protein RecN (Recombination protein N)